MTGQYLIQRSIYQQTGRTLLERPITALHPGKLGWLLVHRAPLFFFSPSCHLINLVHKCFCSKKRWRFSDTGPCSGSPCSPADCGFSCPSCPSARCHASGPGHWGWQVPLKGKPDHLEGGEPSVFTCLNPTTCTVLSTFWNTYALHSCFW